MALWNKAWLESRVRFLMGAVTLTVLCVSFILVPQFIAQRLGAGREAPSTYAAYIHKVTYEGAPRVLFLVFTIALGLGGLVREQELGTAAFSLALPTRRWRLVATRAAVGLSEMTALALLPAVLIPALSPFVDESYPLGQAAKFGLLWIGCGVIVFAASFLVSTAFTGQYTPFLVSWILLVVQSLIAAVPAMRPYHLNLNHFQSGHGMPYFDARTALLIAPFPWQRLAVLLMAAVGLLAAAVYAMERRDF